MNPLHLVLALGPVAIYLFVLSGILFGRHPTVVSGARDSLALALACLGFVVLGPLRLFMPEQSAYLESWVWLPLVALYGLGALLVVMLLRPRLVIYNVAAEPLRPLLDNVARELDADRRWAGSTLVLPNLGVQLTLESWTSMRNVQLVSAGPEQNLEGWRSLEKALRQELAPLAVGPSPRALSCLFFALLLVAVMGFSVAIQPQELASGIDQLLEP